MSKMQETLNEDFNNSITENGATGYRTTGKELLDLNFAVSSLRNSGESEISLRFAKAYYENKLLAVKWLFFASDVRGGMGERRLFRICIKWLAEENPILTLRLILLIPEYSRWDNILVLLDTSLRDEIIEIIRAQLAFDIKNMKENKPVSLIAKWLPSINASSPKTIATAKQIIRGLQITAAQYRKTLAILRKYIGVVEVDMSAKNWGNIDYSAVPSRANLIYNNAFLRNDEKRRREFLESLKKGDSKINAGVLFPHDIVHKYSTERYGWRTYLSDFDETLEEMWKALPDYVDGDGSTICVADGSGSMTSKIGYTNISCLDVANALAIYFAERCSGEFKDKYITFSERPQLVDLSRGNTLRDKIAISRNYNEVANTNIEAVFNLILQTAINNNMTQKEMPSNILILSDMEFDVCASSNNYGGCKLSRNKCGFQKKLFADFADRFAEHGYRLPRLVFWNICSRSETIPLKENELGVALVSGFSPAVMNMVLSNETDPFKCLLNQINGERYELIEKAIKELC